MRARIKILSMMSVYINPCQLYNQMCNFSALFKKNGRYMSEPFDIAFLAWIRTRNCFASCRNLAPTKLLTKQLRADATCLQDEAQEEYFMFYGAGVVGVSPDKKVSARWLNQCAPECIKLRITTNRTLTAHAHYNGHPLLKMYLRTKPPSWLTLSRRN